MSVITPGNGALIALFLLMFAAEAEDSDADDSVAAAGLPRMGFFFSGSGSFSNST